MYSNIAVQNGLRQKIGTGKWGCCYDKFLKMWKHFWNWVKGRGWKNLEEHARKSLDCHKQTLRIIVVSAQKTRVS
jgi:hypothetical protein